MKIRGVAAATLAVAVMMALASCASATGPDTMATANPTPAAASPTPDRTPPSPAATPPAMAEPTSAPGAYVEFTDGAIEATPGLKALFFHASWCPKCRSLDEDLKARGAPDGLTVFKVDYDSRTDLRQKYGVTLQTTVVFVDDAGELISRSVLYDDPSVASLVAAIP
ncbi:thioredoxin family protein [Microbacterium trichothecenolyticum]|uniref:thioredoxin family protein n=1 Tax=Microbacterium trichothecenolyticum TaxID=69370 RepID=UPI0035BE5DDE